MAEVSVFAPAKINLFLHVGERRADGFHDLQSLVGFARMGDTLDLEIADAFSLRIEGPFAPGLAADDDNLVLKAARELASHGWRKDGARIVLTKNLPVASGIGGGSADAAAALRGLIALWDLNIGHDVLHAVAEKLGSDVPVCLSSLPSWMEGRGERVTPAGALPELPIVLVNPRVEVPTSKVFAALETRQGTGGAKPPGWTSADELIAFLKTTANDLEKPARAIAPEIGDVLDALSASEGVRLTRMSGSGATCFGVFADPASARHAAATITSKRPKWWATATTLASDPIS